MPARNSAALKQRWANFRKAQRPNIVRALQATGGNVTHAAAALGMTARSLRRRIALLGVAPGATTEDRSSVAGGCAAQACPPAV